MATTLKADYHLCLPKLKYGWIQSMVLEKEKYKFTLPAGKFLIITPNINVNDANFSGFGNALINYNDGIDLTNAPFNRRSVCLGKGHVGAGVNGDQSRKISSFSDAECQAVADKLMINSKGGFRICTSQVGEAIQGAPDQNWVWDYSTPNTNKIRRATALAIRNAGGEYVGDYDGHNYVDALVNGNGPNSFAQALSSDQAALAFLKDTNIPMGFHSRAFWTENEYLWRGGIIQTYYVTFQGDVARWMFAKLMAFHLDVMAKRAANINPFVIGFSFPMGSDFTGYVDVYKREIPGGYVQSFHQSTVGAGPTIWVNLLAFIMANGTFGWQYTSRFGTDPTFIPTENVQFFGSGTPNRLAAGNGEISTQSSPAPFPPVPFGYQDLPIVAAYLYGKATEFAGTTSWVYAPVKVNGSYPAVNQRTYPLDQYNANTGIAIVLQSDENTLQKALIYCGPAGTITVQVSGLDITFLAPENTPVVHFLTFTQSNVA